MQRFGKYELIRRLGVGGMAEVYLASASAAEGLHKLVVIKQILPTFAAHKNFVAQFVAEAKIALQLNHPNVVQVFDFGQIGESYFLAMEYVNGLDLMRVIKACALQGRKISWGLAAHIGHQVCMGLDYAHRKADEFGRPLHIVHRDVSPQNLLVSYDGAVRILDFGIAKARDSVEEAGALKGKFAYMSPEQAAGEAVDHRSDLFSLGIVLWETSLDRTLFGALKGQAVLDAVKRAEVPAPRQVDPAYPPQLEAIVLKALARDPAERFQTARDLQHALGRWLHGEAEIFDAARLATLVNQVAPPADHHVSELVIADQPTALVPADTRWQPPQPRRREKKNVVLVAGALRGLGPLQQQLGPARGRQLVHDLLRVIEHIAFKHEARVLRLEGSGFLLLLGMPISTEDDCARAVRLSRALVEAVDGIARDLPSAPQLGIGIHRGNALSALADGRDAEVAVARGAEQATTLLASNALAGEILVGGGVYRMARGEFGFSPLDPATPSRGVRIKVYRLLGPLPREERLRAGATPLLVGREMELRHLREALARTISTSRGALVAVLGHAGLGKRAVVNTFLEELSDDVIVLRAAARPSTTDAPYAVVKDLLRELLHLRDDEQPRELKGRIEQTINALTDVSVEERGVLVGTLLSLFSIADTEGGAEQLPDQRRHRILSALRHLLLPLAREQPLAVVLTHMHCADAQSLELCTQLLSDQPGAILGVMTSRVSEAVRQALTATASEVIELDQIDSEAAEALVLRRMVDDPASRRLAAQIVKQAGGNPLFIHEMLESLVERGVLQADDSRPNALLRWTQQTATLPVPTTVEDVVASRIDALAPDERTVLTTAAVLGSSFPRWRLERITSLATAECLGALADRGLLSSHEQGERYAFINDLTRQVAYRLLQTARRRRLHQRVAAQLASEAQGTLDADSAAVARHLEAAGDHAMALQSYLKAARRARAQRDHVEALRLYGGALRVVPEADEATFEIHDEREQIFRAWGRRRPRLRAIRRMLRAAEAADNLGWMAIASNRLAAFFCDIGQTRRAAAAIANSLELARRADRPELEAEARRLRAVTLQAQGETEQARIALEQGLALCGDQPQHLELRAALLAARGELAMCVGAQRDALSAYAVALLIYHRLELPEQESALLERMARAAFELGQVNEALQQLERAARLSRRVRDRAGMARRLAALGQLYAELGDTDQSLPRLGKALQIHLAIGDLQASAGALIDIGRINLRQGNHLVARQLLERGQGLARQVGARHHELLASVFLAQAALAGGSPQRALELIGIAREGAEADALALVLATEAAARLALGELAEALDRSAAATALLPAQAIEVTLEVYRHRVAVLRAADRTRELAQALVAARDVIARRAERLADPAWQRRFLEHPLVRALLIG